MSLHKRCRRAGPGTSGFHATIRNTAPVGIEYFGRILVHPKTQRQGMVSAVTRVLRPIARPENAPAVRYARTRARSRFHAMRCPWRSRAPANPRYAPNSSPPGPTSRRQCRLRSRKRPSTPGRRRFRQCPWRRGCDRFRRQRRQRFRTRAQYPSEGYRADAGDQRSEQDAKNNRRQCAFQGFHLAKQRRQRDRRRTQKEVYELRPFE